MDKTATNKGMTAKVMFIYEKIIADAAIKGSDLVAEYRSKFQRSERTFWSDWEKAKSAFAEQNNKIVNKVNEKYEQNALANVEEEFKAAENRKTHIRNQIKIIDKKLESGKTFDTFIHEGTAKRFERDLTPSEISRYIATSKSLHAELSLMGGDYAPAKQETKLIGDITVEVNYTDET